MHDTIWDSEGTDENYQHNRLGDSREKLREWVDEAYYKKNLRTYLDKNFVDQLRNNHFFARLWELELAECLETAGLKMIPTNRKGPDFCIELSDGRKLWIEAVLATPDEAMTKRWLSRFGKPGEIQMFDFPKNENWMRFSSSLYTKAEKIKEKYIDKSIIASDDLVLIAISAFPPGALHPEMEHFLRATLPIGDPVVHFSTNGKPLDPNKVRATHTDEPAHVKDNGSSVLKQFLYPGTYFPYIDGVMFSEASNLQQLLGVWSIHFDESTNTPHIFPNHASNKKISPEFTDNFYSHQYVEGDPYISLKELSPKRRLML